MRRWRAGHAFAWIPILALGSADPRKLDRWRYCTSSATCRSRIMPCCIAADSLARCETNDKEKTAAIAEAEARITDLTSTIEELTATSARLNTEIKNLEAEIAKNQEASVVGA